MNPQDLTIGQSVRIHPATDLFMKGVVHAQVIRVGREYVTLYHSSSNTRHKCSFGFARAYFMNPNGEMMFEQEGVSHGA